MLRKHGMQTFGNLLATSLLTLVTACAGARAVPTAHTMQHGPHAMHQHGAQHGATALHGGHETGHRGQGMHHRFDDPERWAAVFDDPARDAWQQPDALVRWLALAPDARVADLGAGTGYFSVRLARVVPSGRVYAQDIEPALLRHLRARAERDDLANVRIVLGTTDDPLLPERVDLALMVDTYHHIADRVAYFTRVRERLRPGGRVVIVDFRPASSMGPPAEHKVSPETVTSEMARAGFVAEGRFDALSEQYVLAFRAAPR